MTVERYISPCWSVNELQTVNPDSFAGACLDSNSLDQLESDLDTPDEGDMEAWGLDANEWTEQVTLALFAMRYCAAQEYVSSVIYAVSDDDDTYPDGSASVWKHKGGSEGFFHDVPHADHAAHALYVGMFGVDDGELRI